MRVRRTHREESGVSLVEMMIALVLFSLVVVAVDSSLTIVQERQVQVTNGTEGLDMLQVAQEAITTDLHAATSWGWTPVAPATSGSVTPTPPLFLYTASLNGSTAMGIALTTTHQLQVCSNANTTTTPVTSSSVCSGSSIQMQAKVNNVDPSSLITLTTSEVSITNNGLTTNSFFYTSASTTLILDSPSVGAAHVSQTTLTSPTLVIYNGVYACQTALAQAGATGSC
jgi:Tfp pilus assembly protein PilW